MTTRMLRLPHQKTLGLALTAAASLLLPGISLAATTCAEVRAQNPAAQDGTYSLTLGSQQVAMYCHDMAGTPREYLTLPNSEPSPELVHRYSFTTSGVDSVSGADASLLGGATLANGEVVLNGWGAYVSMPIGGTVASLQSATFEAWVKWPSSSGQTWARVFDFNDGGNKFLFLTPRNGRLDSGPVIDTPRFAITTQFISGAQQATSASPFPVGTLTHVAVTLDGAAGITRLYVNGTQVAQQNTTLTPAALGTTPNNWLGRSMFSADPFLKGSISEFRVYRTALSPSRIAAHSSAGPDQLDDGQAPEPCTSGEPRLLLNGSSPMTLECGSAPYSDPGAQAFDGCGNPIQVHAYNTGTDSSGPGPNTSAEGSYSVSYAAWDAMGHTASALRTVNVEDRTAPSLMLIGPAFMTHTCGSQWVDPGVEAADACYGNVSAQVQRTGEVNGWAPGTYTVTYSLTDSGGNTATPVTRTVQVANCPW